MRYNMRVTVKDRYKDELTLDVANRILGCLGLPFVTSDDFFVTKGNGRSLIFEDSDRKLYVIVSRQQADARNAFLSQYIPTVLEEYVSDTAVNKEIKIFLLDTSNKATTPFIIDTYRSAKTLKIDIINEKDLGVKIIPYLAFKDWKNAKNDRQEYNRANNSSYAMEDENGITVYGKLYGANGKESTFVACVLSEIAKSEEKSVKFVQVQDHGTEIISASDKNLLAQYNVDVAEGAIILENKEVYDKSTCRKQDEFKYNLLEKYGAKKCYLCDCDIEQTIIASHIHRIADIDKMNISSDEKRRMAVDADNGLWLCANHDKMFENGILTFDKNGNLILNPYLKDNQKDFIDYITNVAKVKDGDMTEEFLKYLDFHNNRVNLGK